MLNLPAREAKARIWTFLREKIIFDHGLFTSYEDKKKRGTGNISAGLFRDTQGLHVWIIARARIHPAQDLHHRPRSLDVPFILITCALYKLVRVDQYCLELDFPLFC